MEQERPIHYSENIQILKKYFSALVQENTQLQEDILFIKNGLDQVSEFVTQLSGKLLKMESDLSQNQNRIHQVSGYFNEYEMENPYIHLKDKEKPQTEKTNPCQNSGIMIFITLDQTRPIITEISDKNNSSPIVTLYPEEENIIQTYFIRNKISLPDKEYQLFKREISIILAEAPKNAIALEIKPITQNTQKIVLQVFFHLKINNDCIIGQYGYLEYPITTS
jgi:hypothetical protein